VKLTHVRLLVDDFAGCFRFYRDVLGLEVTWGDENDGYADFRAGDATIALIQRNGQAEVVELRPSGDGSMVILAVDSVDEAAARLREHLVNEPQSRPDWGIRFAHLRDPAGTLIEINEPIQTEDE
jgi:catechol 2,3-dioxygenase-like lactoylglutathione lyase family enzyme